MTKISDMVNFSSLTKWYEVLSEELKKMVKHKYLYKKCYMTTIKIIVGGG